MNLPVMSADEITAAMKYASRPGDHQDIQFLDVPHVGQVVIYKAKYTVNNRPMSLAHGPLISKYLRRRLKAARERRHGR
jgi:hypothetical protein